MPVPAEGPHEEGDGVGRQRSRLSSLAGTSSDVHLVFLLRVVCPLRTQRHLRCRRDLTRPRRTTAASCLAMSTSLSDGARTTVGAIAGALADGGARADSMERKARQRCRRRTKSTRKPSDCQRLGLGRGGETATRCPHPVRVCAQVSGLGPDTLGIRWAVVAPRVGRTRQRARQVAC